MVLQQTEGLEAMREGLASRLEELNADVIARDESHAAETGKLRDELQSVQVRTALSDSGGNWMLSDEVLIDTLGSVQSAIRSASQDGREILKTVSAMSSGVEVGGVAWHIRASLRRGHHPRNTAQLAPPPRRGLGGRGGRDLPRELGRDRRARARPGAPLFTVDQFTILKNILLSNLLNQ